jgi:hypothetical protein
MRTPPPFTETGGIGKTLKIQRAILNFTPMGELLPPVVKFFPRRNGRKIDQMPIKYTNVFRCKAHQNFTKLEDFWFEKMPSGNPGTTQLIPNHEIYVNKV